jgi:hypothetical protein
VSDLLRDEINKRLTLNLLIQGSAQHAFLTSHYLVRDELNAINPKLLLLYDRIALAGFMQYWQLSGVLGAGVPAIFWRRAACWPHPFRKHPLLSRHGLALADTAKARAVERCREKGVTRIPALFDFQTIYFLNRLNVHEARHRVTLVALAKRVTQMVWGIPVERLDAAITPLVRFGKLRWPTSIRGALLRLCAAGYGGVLPTCADGDQFRVVARGWNWPILSHELVKGTVELICLHGLIGLEDVTYKRVLRAADRPEYEPWLLQTGCELWRRLLPLLPDGRPVAEIIMRLARLRPVELQDVMLAVIEQPDRARSHLESLSTETPTDGDST